MALFLNLLIIAIIGVLLVFYFMRTSVELPKTWPQLKTEIKFIIGGIRGCAQDIGLSFRNKLCKYLVVFIL